MFKSTLRHAIRADKVPEGTLEYCRYFTREFDFPFKPVEGEWITADKMYFEMVCVEFDILKCEFDVWLGFRTVKDEEAVNETAESQLLLGWTEYKE